MNFALVSMLVGSSALSQPALSVKVDSFSFAGRATSAAEICGHVVGEVKTSQQILIVSDPKSKSPGKYVVSTTPTGEFCAVISTAGQADTSILGAPPAGSIVSADAEAFAPRAEDPPR
jgi:hypothetical protein